MRLVVSPALLGDLYCFIKRGEEAALLRSIKNIMDSLKLPAVKAMEILKIPVTEQSKYLARL